MRKKIFFGIVFVSFLAALGFGLGLHFYYIENRSMAPDPVAGRVNPVPAHGPPVYVSKGEKTLLYGLEGAAFGLFIVGFFLQRRWKDELGQDHG